MTSYLLLPVISPMPCSKMVKMRPCFKVTCLLLAYLFIFYLYSLEAHACTVWAAIGDKAGIKGVIVGKNRDNLPHLVTEVRFISPDHGNKIFGLFDVEADGYIVGGINNKGLVVFNASAVSVPKEKRHVAKEDFTERLLKSFDSVESALKDRDIFSKSHPALYMLADPVMIAMVEIAPGGKIAVNKKENGYLAFTNHFIDSGLSKENKNNTLGSKERLRRIGIFLSRQNRPFTIDDFIAMSEDREGGPDCAIWRTGSSEEKVRTLAGFVFAVPSTGVPEVYIKLANPGEHEKIIRGKLDFMEMKILTP